MTIDDDRDELRDHIIVHSLMLGEHFPSGISHDAAANGSEHAQLEAG